MAGVGGGSLQVIKADLVASAGGCTPDVSLYSQAGGTLTWLDAASMFVPERRLPGVAVVGVVSADFALNLPDFRAGVAFYPGCNHSLKARGGYTPAAPITFFIGGSDDWTAPGPCVDLAAKLAAAGEDATITVYPDTYHGFDGPSTQPRKRLEVPNGVNPGKGVTVATNPAARDDAYAKLTKYLREHLGP